MYFAEECKFTVQNTNLLVFQQVHEYDELPKRICVICLQAIRSSYYFKNQAENAYSVLLNQTETSSSVPFTRIKRENLALNSKSSPVISAPRTIENENFSDDLLLEIGS